MGKWNVMSKALALKVNLYSQASFERFDYFNAKDALGKSFPIIAERCLPSKGVSLKSQNPKALSVSHRMVE